MIPQSKVKCFLGAVSVFALAAALPVLAQDAGVPAKEELEKAYTNKTYSPYAGRNFPEKPLWGDSHLHTMLSMDAGMFGNRMPPREAYEFARGNEVISSTGQPVRLSRPLDWLVIADHSDGMGMAGDVISGAPAIQQFEQGRRWSSAVAEGGEAAVEATLDLITTFSQDDMEPEMMAMYMPGSKPYKNLWEQVIADAEEFNDPGVFTAFIGFEWTSLIRGNNMHRVVMMRDGATRTSQVVPFTMTAPWGSPNPRDLWKYLADYEENTGGEILAIAHNGNLSNGIMFPLEAQYDGTKLDESYVTQRAKWEPVYEVTQIKGDGEAHPFLSPDDEFADFETWDVGNLDISEAKTNEMLAGEYGRSGLKRGLQIAASLGTNPYKFGMIGATDAHTSLASIEEENFYGKHPGTEPSAERMTKFFSKTDKGQIMDWQLVAGGVAAVWANENTRASIFDAMLRKEVYGTTGPRIRVRFFGGWEFTDADINTRTPAVAGGCRLQEGRADGWRSEGDARWRRSAQLHGLCAARFDWRQSGPHSDH